MATTAPQPASIASAASAPGQKHGEIVGLNGLRFLAAMLVMTHHLTFWKWYPGRTASAVLPSAVTHLAPFTWFGFTGVEIFFVLSGFVIAYSASNSDALGFVRRRIVRIYPTAWICATLTFAVLLVLHQADWSTWLHSVWLYFASPPFVDGSFWTLPLELTFYTLIALLLAVKRFRWLELAMILLGSYSSLINVVMAVTVAAPSSARWQHRVQYTFFSWKYYLLLAPFGVFFALGGLLWLCSYHGITPRRVGAIALFTITGIVAVVLQAQGIQRVAGYSQPVAVAVGVWIFSVLLIILSVRYNQLVRTVLRPRGIHCARVLGLMTFPVYLLHQRLGFLMIDALRPHLPLSLAFLLTEAAVLLAGFLIVHSIEPPLNRALSQLLGLRSKERAASTTPP